MKQKQAVINATSPRNTRIRHARITHNSITWQNLHWLMLTIYQFCQRCCLSVILTTRFYGAYVIL